MITISFQCKSSDDVLLLTTLYDVLNVEDVDNSITLQENIGWLVDTIAARLKEVDRFDIGSDKHRLKGFVLEVMKVYWGEK